MMSSDETAAVRARVEKATPGPWRAVIQPSWIPFVVLRERCAESSQLDTSMLHNEDDAQFIAHAREDVPNLLAALAAQTARSESLERALLPLAEGYGWQSDWCGWCQRLLSEERVDCPMVAVRAVLATAQEDAR